MKTPRSLNSADALCECADRFPSPFGRGVRGEGKRAKNLNNSCLINKKSFSHLALILSLALLTACSSLDAINPFSSSAPKMAKSRASKAAKAFGALILGKKYPAAWAQMEN